MIKPKIGNHTLGVPTMNDLTVYALGSALIQRGGETLGGFVSQKTVALFVYLLCHPYEHPREAIAERFWAETTTEQALKNLRTVLSSLQKQLGDHLYISRHGLAIADPDRIGFDVRTFETHLQAAADLMARPSSPRRRQAELEAALSHYRGDFLLGLKADNAPDLETWLSVERDRLRARMTEARLNLMRVALQRGEYALGIEQGVRLVAAEPFWEEAYRLLMTLHTRANHRTAALHIYEHLCTLLADELDTEPEPETQALAQAIRTRKITAPATPPRPSHNLPPLGGRYVPVPALAGWVADRLDSPGCRLLTLLGIGGAGKTKLAQVTGHQRLDDYADGVYFVPLESLPDAGMVPNAVLAALGVHQPDETRSATQTVIEALRARHCLLILDNFEHVLPAAAFVSDLLAACPALQIMVTSREQLALGDEYIIPMGGMPHAPGEADSPAVRLFALAAQQVNPAFDLTRKLAAVGDICQQVEGLPLGILIAASWMQTLSAREVADRIAASLDTMTLHRRDLPERHRGITALLLSMWQSLPDHERAVLAALSAFPGDFDAAAARAVAGADVDTLAVLVAKSLVQYDGEGRYHLHGLLRRFTRQQAESDGRWETIRRAHLTYFQAWIDHLYAAQRPPNQQHDIIDRDYHNLWYFDGLNEAERLHHALTLAKVLPDYWFSRGQHLQEGIALLRGALPHATGWLAANLQVRLGRLLARSAYYTEAHALLLTGLSLARSEGDRLLEALALAELNCTAAGLGDFESAHDYLLEMTSLYDPNATQDSVVLREVFARGYSNLAVTYLQMAAPDQAEHYARLGLQAHRDAAAPVGEALSLNTLGIVALDRNDPAQARVHFEAALAIAHAIGHRRYQALFGANLAEALYRLGDFDGAFQRYIHTLREAYRMDNRKTQLNVLEQLATLALDRGDPAWSARLLGMALALRDSLGAPVQPRQMQEYADRKARLIAALGEDGLEAQIQTGRSTTVPAILDEFQPDSALDGAISDF